VYRHLIAAVLLAGCLPGCNPAKQREPAAITRWPVMSTIAELSLPAAVATNAPVLQPIVATVFDAVESDLSLFKPESELARINRNAGTNGPVAISDTTVAVLAYAIRVARESQGAFDPTVSPLMKLWGFRGGTTPFKPPAPDAIAATLRQLGWQHIELLPRDSATVAATARLALPGMQLDLGGIAKGFAVDRAYEALRDNGCNNFLINLAGNMRGHGNPEATRHGWRVGVRNPLQAGTWLGTLALADGEGIATSGNYERYVVIDGKRYTHIIDPRTGHPVAGLVSVTVLATSAMEADALSTALFVLGVDNRHELLSAHAGCGAIYLLDTHPPRLLVTPDLKSRFHPVPVWQDAVEWL
jgi:thiamine biosynthesis lipoprotein